MDAGESSSGRPDTTDASTSTLQHARIEAPAPKQQGRQKWKFHLRPDDDDQPQDWWFCSTAIPLLAATTGPLANVMSIAALVTSWRNKYDPANPGIDADSIGFPDPRWCLGLNGASLACGFAGNIFLLFNFTRRIRYIVALPVTIILWYFATGIVCHCLFTVLIHVTPPSPMTTSSQSSSSVIHHVVFTRNRDIRCSSRIVMADSASSLLSPHLWTNTCLPTDQNRPIAKASGMQSLLPFFTSSHR